ncbi:hypothetical protein PAESOLCIP111_02258 [Paenibacillus solanacearum]|uniref:DUF3231 family protein n=1 Tax=Paenibacillus solanacearum TaxID=2048548 RepID=A0A916K008_9BACL|nr:DUF3231 family protein [Paenibacillus solanacearum]CAG7620222.1 hypothetical protein PAESOLCIP111_02258 [Paenibacillus solanacearum]
MNILETITEAIKPFLDGEKPPLNAAEVMNLWFYLTATEQTLRGEQVSFNIVHDPELREVLEDMINNVHNPIRTELTQFLREEGVPLPQSTPEKPIGDFRSIPEGSRLSDEECANLMLFNLVLGVNYACRGMTESVRADVAARFAKYLAMKMALAMKLKNVASKKGWLMQPPAFHPERPLPTQ